MENYLSHSRNHPNRSFASSLPKKPHSNNVNGGFTSSVKTATTYADVFGGPPRFGGAPSLSPRLEDYCEIFSGFNGSSRAAAAVSSIPVLDLPLVDDNDKGVSFDVRRESFDYREVFGGVDDLDLAPSYEELFLQQRRRSTVVADDGDSSDDAWTPEEEEVESVSGKSPSFSNGRDSYDSIDGCTEFINISYHKASLVNDAIRVAPDVGYTVAVDEMVGASGGRGKVDKETGPSSSLAFEDKDGDHHQKYYHPSEPFVTVSEIGLKTHPTGIPPPSRPPPVLKSGFRRSGSNSRTTGSDGSTEGGSPPFFDVEVDASSAAVREAMVKAEAKLKSAKELFEKKREGKSSHVARRRSVRDENGSKSLSSQGSVNSDGNEEWEEATQFVELVRTEQPRNADENSGGEDVPFPLNAGFLDQKLTRAGHESKKLPKHPGTRKVASKHKRREDRLASEEPKNEKLRDVELQFEIGNNLTDHGGVVKHRNLLKPEESKHYTGVAKQKRADRKAAEKNQDNVFDWEQNARKLREALGLSDNESTLEVPLGMHGEMDESETKLKQALRRIEEETSSKEARLKKETEAFEKAENEKRLRAALEQEEKVKKLKEENERKAAEAREKAEEEERKRKEQEENERRLKEAFEKEEENRRMREAREKAEQERRMKEQEEYERRLKEAFEKEEKNRRMREAREKAENERKMKEAREKEENERRRIKEAQEKAEVERRMKETLEREEKERKLRELQEREAYERRAKEALEQAENEMKLKEAREKEENEKKLKEAIELEEKEKRLIEAFERAETERRLKEELEQEEMRLQEANERERTLRENQERQEKEMKQDACEMEKTCETTNEANGEQCSKENLSDSSEEDERVDNHEPVNKVQVEEEEEGPSQRVSVSEEACPWKVFEKNLKDASQNEGTSELETESVKLNGESVEESASVTDNVQGGKLNQKSKTVEDKSEDAKARNGSGVGDQRNPVENKSASKASSRPLPSRVFMEREKEAERIKRELDSKMEHLRKIEEEREREREREKDRMAFDQRALADARERLEKACAEARDRSFPDNKAAMEARLRAERAAVERATAEARERAAEKAAFEARDRMERSVSDKQLKSSGLFGERMERSVSEKQFQNSASFGASRYQNSPGADGESPQRYTSRLERHRRTADRVAKALAEKNMRDLVAQREQAERTRIAETLDAEVKRWSSGKEGNIRALLSTLQYILGSESGWQPLPLTEVITSAAVKRAYRKATLCVHPDKLQQRGANIHQKYICEKVFDLLKEAWNKFNSEER